MIQTINDITIEAMASEIKRLGVENEKLKFQLYEQFELSGKSILKLSQKNLEYLKSLNRAYLLMQKFVFQYRKGINSNKIFNFCIDMQMFCADFDFKHASIANLIENQLNDECLDCGYYGVKEGECKGMIGGAPCLSFQEKRISPSMKSRWLNIFN